MEKFFYCLCAMILLGLPGMEAKTKCVKVVGKLECDIKPEKNAFATITLMDHDNLGLPWEQDDTMGKSISEEDGRFEISGCGYDLFFFNNPDPFIKIHHQCHNKGDDVWETLEFGFLTTWFPGVTSVGTVYLDD